MQRAMWKENKTLKEWVAIMPTIYIDRSALSLLLCWCCLPFVLMIFNIISPVITDRIHFMMMLGIGMLGILLGIISWVKVKTSDNYKRKPMKELVSTYGERIFLLFMLVWGFISCFFAKDIYLAFLGNGYRNDGFISYIAYAGYFILALVLKEEKYRKLFLLIFTGVASLLSFLTILQFYGVYMPVFIDFGMYSAIFYNSNHFGYYLVMAILTVGGMYVISNTKTTQLLLLIEFVILNYALCINDTFGSYLGVCVALIAALIGFTLIKKHDIIKIGIIILAFILVSVIFNEQYGTIENNFAVLFHDTSKIIRNAEDSNMAGTNRWELWCDSVNFIMKRPIFGYGIEGYENAYIENNKGMIIDRPHNEYLQHALFMGVPALLFYLTALFWILIRAVKNRKFISNSTQVALFAMIAYLGSAFFGNTMFYTVPYFMIILGIASLSQCSEKSFDE